MNTEKVDITPSAVQEEVQAAVQASIAKVKEDATPPNPYADRVYVFPEGLVPRKLPILLYPDKRLEQVSVPVEHFGSGLDQFAANLVATAVATDAAGLSAIQVGAAIRLMAVRIAKAKDFVVLVNPSFIELSLTDMVLVEEGCLSFPGAKEKVDRARKVKVAYQDLKGEHREMELVVDDPATYVAGQAVQHEYEHLDGLLLLANLNLLHRDRVRLHMKQVHRKLEVIQKKSGGKFPPMQLLFGYIPDPEPKAAG